MRYTQVLDQITRIFIQQQFSDTTLSFDLREYYHSQPEMLLGILTHIVGPPPATPAAA
ncbi:MAG TPA: hypothetical protein VG122_25715 [Gemmata sp.]|nr:hypothetical protein [Gemmata sp.]